MTLDRKLTTGPRLFAGSRTRSGLQGDTHPAHFHGNTLISDDGLRVDAVNLASAAIRSLDMLIDNSPGNWLVHW